MSERTRVTNRSPVISSAAALVALSFIFLLAAAPVSGQTEPVTWRVGYYNNQPVSYITGGGNHLGLALDILRYIADQEGIEIVIHHDTREGALRSLEEGEIDIIAGIEVPCDQISGIELGNETLISNWGEIYSAEDIEVGSLMDLEEKYVGVVRGDLYSEGRSGLRNLIDSFDIDAYLVEFDNYNEVLDAIESGNVDAGCLNSLLGLSVEDRRDIRRTGIVYNPVDIRFGFDPNGTSSVSNKALIDGYLRNLKSDDGSVYYSSLEDYIDKDEGGRSPGIPEWLLRSILLLIAVVVFLTIVTLILRARIRSRTRDLVKANERLDRDIKRRTKLESRLEEERNRSILYLDLLIHDIGNIHHGLMSTMQFYDMVKEDREKADSTKEKATDLIGRSISLIDNVRKISDLEKKPVKPEKMDLRAILKSSSRSVALSFPEKNPDIRIKLPSNKIEVLAEPLLEEVFFNLFHNAVKYNLSDRPLVEAELMELKEKRTARIEIHDQGWGIKDDRKGMIFHRSTAAADMKHTGIGLSLVKVLLDRYNGTIEVKDRVKGDHKKGSVFIVHLPIS